jgi:hypothetical protein
MSKAKVRLLAFVVVALAISNWFYAHRAAAKPQSALLQATCSIDVPTSWGEYVGSSAQYGLAFKDDAGTLRFVANVPCTGVPQVALQVNRGNPPN